MGGGFVSDGPPTQSTLITCVFAFNLSVGVGALVLPYSVNEVGWVFGSGLILLVTVLGFITVTFMLEAIGNTSAIVALQGPRGEGSQDKNAALLSAGPAEVVGGGVGKGGEEDGEAKCLFAFRHLEMANMADTLFPKWGQTLFYLIICIYLYGDLAIYAAFVPNTLADFTHLNYNIFLLIFSVCMIPFSFFNFQKTKYLQMATLATRNAALFSMIALTVVFMAEGKGSTDVKPLKPDGVSGAFGNIVYAFMVHHSIPSLIAPMKNKKQAGLVFVSTFSLVMMVYVTLSVTAIFAFGRIENNTCSNHPNSPCKIQKMFTENFSSYNQRWLGEFLTLFPVFTLTSNFPLISITLRNNLLALFEKFGWSEHRWAYPLCCILSPGPPLILAFIVHDVSALVAFTGGYAGLCIMFVIPSFLVRASRIRIKEQLGSAIPKHDLKSPFSHPAWVYLILVWSLVCVSIITTNNILQWTK